MNVPNSLTCSRLVLAAVLMALLSIHLPFAKTIALLTFIIAAITDFLDGYLARNKYGVTNFGKLMDPLADKIIVGAAFVGFVGITLGIDNKPLIPAWAAVLIISREFVVTGLRLLAVEQGRIISAGAWGKQKTIWQMVSIILLLAGLALRDDWLHLVNGATVSSVEKLLRPTAMVCMVLVVLVTVVSGYIYLKDNRDLFLKDA